MSEFNEKFRRRSKHFCISVVKLCSTFPYKLGLTEICKQLIRSSTSVAANFRACTRARSNKELFAKYCIVVEECDESLFWLEILLETGFIEPEKLEPLMIEAEELLKVFSVSKKKIGSKLHKT